MHKHHKRPPSSRDRQQSEVKPRAIPSTAYVQAYESQLIYGQHDRAEELYSKGPSGRGLMRWLGDGEDGGQVWADRHDIIHLLTELPSSSGSGSRRSPSPTLSSSSSWDSLPSDLEETFHLSDPTEIEAYERTKRTNWMEALREARLREREEEDRHAGLLDEGEKGKGKAPSWPEDEIPPHTITTLMSHTAASLLASPNPQILESRILLNHASDERFDFLKGRWRSTWERTKKDARAKRDLASGRVEKEKKAISGLIGAYDSDSDDEQEKDTEPEVEPPPPPIEDLPVPPSPPSTRPIEQLPETKQATPVTRDGDIANEAEKQRLRRLKAEEWKKKRAQGKPT